jgi:sugar/nucleoside kinase (ribokinase family)
VAERPDVIVVGDLMLDVSVAAGDLARGGDVRGHVRVQPAGSAANAAVWAAHAGASVRFHGRIGDDLPGRLLREALEARGVEACLTIDPEARTGSMLIVREAGDRSMVADRGANARLAPEDLPNRLEAGVVLVSGYCFFDPGSEAAGRAALDRAGARHVAVEASSWPLLRAYGPQRFMEATRAADLLFANVDEYAVLRDAANSIEAFPWRHVATKHANGGQVMETATGRTVGDDIGFDEDAVDSTGAGDAFDGAFLATLAHGGGFNEALAAGIGAGHACAMRLDPWPEIT